MRLSLFCLLIIFFAQSTNAQTVTVPYDTNTVTIDGVLNSMEWQHRLEVVIPNTSTDSVIVWCKHDMNALYYAFSGNLDAGPAFKFPEVLLDPQYVRTTAWQPGQWWFHVSAQDCEHNGAYGVYDSCAVTQPGWDAGPNFTPSPPASNMVEIRIPFSKIGFNPSTQDTLAMSVLVSNTSSFWKLWPMAADTGKPDTWSTAIISKIPASINKVKVSKGLKVYPNPSEKVVYIENLTPSDRVVLTDMYGRVIRSIVADRRTISINVGGLHSGLYMIQAGGSVERIRVMR